MSTAFNSSSTSSSLIFSPRFVKTAKLRQHSNHIKVAPDVLYLSWPTPMKPVMSLSNTWKPRQYSSGSPGSRNPPGRFRTFWKDSKSTIVAQTQEISHVSLLRLDKLCLCRNLQAPPTPFSKSCISANVGFCPHARRRSPSDSRATRPLPRLSKRANASL